MQKFSTSPLFIFKSFYDNLSLIIGLAKRDILGRYQGSIMGVFWSFINPILMLIIYTFIFSVVFKARWSIEADSRADFALLLFAGLIVFNFFSECINKAPTLIVDNVNYVKKIVFPLEILTWVSILSALFHALISTAVWLIFYCAVHGLPHVTVILFPIIFVPLIFLMAGMSWMLSAAAVYLRDTAQIIGMFTTVLMFLSPIFYPISALPEKYKFLVYLNPLAPCIDQIREILFWGHFPSPYLYISQILIFILIAWIGLVFFQNTRIGFSDAI